MAALRRCVILFFASFSLLSLAVAASPASFCKCTCFSNSTIIPLDGGASSSSSSSIAGAASAGGRRTCNDCNRQFCLDYNLPICKGAEEKDVFTTCFQRDSVKDEAVVFIFIIATVGLLVYAALKPWVRQWADKVRERNEYVPLSGEGDQ